MSQAGIAGMRAAADDIFRASRSFDANEWQTPSAAAGWSVQDVVSHIGCLLELLQSAVRGDPIPDTGIEVLNERMVAERRDWDATRTLDNLQKQLDQAIAVFSTMQDPPTSCVETPMLDLGTYQLHAIADMFVFDITTHLRYDILSPRGPITRQLPSLDETCLGPAVSWLLGGFLVCNPASIATSPHQLCCVSTGPAAPKCSSETQAARSPWSHYDRQTSRRQP